MAHPNTVINDKTKRRPLLYSVGKNCKIKEKIRESKPEILLELAIFLIFKKNYLRGLCHLKFIGKLQLTGALSAKNTSASRYFAGALTQYSAPGGILGKGE